MAKLLCFKDGENMNFIWWHLPWIIFWNSKGALYLPTRKPPTPWWSHWHLLLPSPLKSPSSHSTPRSLNWRLSSRESSRSFWFSSWGDWYFSWSRACFRPHKWDCSPPSKPQFRSDKDCQGRSSPAQPFSSCHRTANSRQSYLKIDTAKLINALNNKPTTF